MKNKILIITANYYKSISKSLYECAKKTLSKESIHKVKCNIIEVPGIFEIPVIISKNINKYDAFVALGCVIKGETPHFDYISKTTFDAIMKLSIYFKKPIGNGIITALNIKQAKERSSAKKNKGRESTRAVLSILGNLKNE